MINKLLSQRYEIVERVGEGPIYTVYKARDVAMNRVVAVKALKDEYVNVQIFVDALRNAHEETVSLNYPGITRFYEFRDEDEAIYAVLEFVRGIDLKERIRRIAPFTLSLTVDLACALAEALMYAHRAGQIHGDLRPQHIIISPEGVLKVSGFGQQKAATRHAPAQLALLTQSCFYHAPEVSTTSAGTAAGDVYSVGAILYEMLTGATVYTGGTPDDQAEAHALNPIPSARTVNPGVPKAMDAIITRCLQKKPEGRYASMAELLSDLKLVRDALRFGKPVQLPGEEAVAAAPQPRPAPVAPREQAAPAPEPAYRPESYGRNKLRAQDERVSSGLKMAMTTVGCIILGCCVWAYGIYISHWVMPPPTQVPQLEGKNIEEVRKIAADNKFKLIEHAEYIEKPRGIVYQCDQQQGTQLRAAHSINVWYSKGPEFVDVPNVVGLSREDAENKLKDSGLKVGRVTPEYNDKTPENVVLNQDVPAKKSRVYHDTVVSLTVSNGPAPGTNTGNGDATNPGDGANPDGTQPDPGNKTPDTASDQPTHSFSRSISINKDGHGRRQVRVEYADAAGEHPPVIDEGHDEGDKIPIKFDYLGDNITLRVYYNGEKAFENTFDPQKTRRRTIK